MTECQGVRSLLADNRLEELPRSLQATVADHLAACPECGAAHERAVLLDFAIDAGLRGVPAPEACVRRESALAAAFRHRALKLAAAVVFTSAVLAGAGWLAAPIIEGWRFPGADTTPVRPEYALLGMPSSADNNAAKTARLGPWTIEQDHAPGFATFDAKVYREHGPSIRLEQRSGSGNLRRQIPIPVPRGTRITFGAWVLSPRGGSGTNKYFSMEIWPKRLAHASPDEGGDSSVYLFDPSPNWHPIVLRSELEGAADSFSVVMSVANGYGRYFSNDWDMWVDDVFIAVVIPLKAEIELDRDKVVVDAALPTGYDESMVDPGSIRFSAYDPADGEGIAGKVLPSLNTRFVRIEIDSTAAVAAMHHRNRDTQGPPTGRVNGRFNYRGYSVPFEIGLIAGGNDKRNAESSRR
ncbi:MAG: anti-sigma factor family protein [Fimbriimonadaceae bacterium]